MLHLLQHHKINKITFISPGITGQQHMHKTQTKKSNRIPAKIADDAPKHTFRQKKVFHS